MQISLSITWAIIGLILIGLSWIEQVIYLKKNKNKISCLFVGLYSLGVAFLVLDGFVNNNFMMAILNLITLVFSGIVFILIKKK